MSTLFPYDVVVKQGQTVLFPIKRLGRDAHFVVKIDRHGTLSIHLSTPASHSVAVLPVVSNDVSIVPVKAS